MQRLDRDEDGKISLNDFAQCAAMLGLVQDAPAVAADSGDSGDSSDDEPAKPRRESLAQKAARLFDQLDGDGSGSIDENELDMVLQGLGLEDPELRAKQVSHLSQYTKKKEKSRRRKKKEEE